MQIIGITGTNGKTTTAYLVDSILIAGGNATGLIGTIGYRAGKNQYSANWTTPESSELHRLLSEMKDHGTETVIMEVSSHALEQFRVDGLVFRLGLFTNLSQDHLDYHRSMVSYAEAKQKLFRQVDSVMGENIINGDDPAGKMMAQQNNRPVLKYSTAPGDCDVFPESVEYSIEGIRSTLNTPAGEIKVRSRLVGKHNLYNIMAAVCTGLALKIPVDALENGITGLVNVPGRLEPVDAGQKFTVLVDYAHTPDAMENAINSVKPLVNGNLIVLYGCGGDRDKGKRPMMGRIAERSGARSILTSDNPRTEDPELIIRDVLSGVEQKDEMEVYPDRTEAIHKALTGVGDEDCVLLLGKGHETYQILGTERIFYDDREVAREFIRKNYPAADKLEQNNAGIINPGPSLN